MKVYRRQEIISNLKLSPLLTPPLNYLVTFLIPLLFLISPSCAIDHSPIVIIILNFSSTVNLTRTMTSFQELNRQSSKNLKNPLKFVVWIIENCLNSSRKEFQKQISCAKFSFKKNKSQFVSFLICPLDTNFLSSFSMYF